MRATVALCRLAALAHHAYQHREEISAVARQFMDDIQNNAHHDPEWLAQNGYIFTHVLSDVFVVPQIGNKLMNTGSMRPLANGLKRQTEAAQACIRKGVNAAGQKACDNLKNILQNAGEALKTGNPQPAFAGIQNNASLRTVPDQADRVDGLMKKAGDSTAQSTGQILEKDLAEMYKKSTLGKGSTGRMIPQNLHEQLAMKEVISNPLSNARELQSIRMTDPRWLEQDGWVKMSKNVNNIEIHYVYNTKTDAFDDFKFK